MTSPSILDRILDGAGHPLKMSDDFEPDDASQVDVDEDVGDDLGDAGSRHVATIPPTHLPALSAVYPGAAASRIVPFDRVLSYHRYHQTNGRDVLAIQRALSFAHLRWHAPTMTYGWLVRDEVKLLQHRHGLEATGVYGRAEHALLAPFFDGYCRWLYTHRLDHPKPAGRSPAERSVRAAWYLYAHRPMAYHEVRPFLLYPYTERIGYTFDCSWLATEDYYLAGRDDPNGYAYRGGAGNTTTLKQHGNAVGAPIGGDLVFYGTGTPFDPDHVAVSVGRRRVVSLGSPGGPYLLPDTYRAIQQIRRYPS